jgi:hypothetical protein
MPKAADGGQSRKVATGSPVTVVTFTRKPGPA